VELRHYDQHWLQVPTVAAVLQKEQQERGFSLIELLFVLAVTAIALGIGVPSFTALFANQRMSSATNDLVSSLHAARSEAIKRQVTVTVCPTVEGDGPCLPGGSLASGWTVFVDRNGDAAISADDVVVQRHAALPPEMWEGLTVNPPAAPGYIIFAGSGAIGTPARPDSLTDIQICDHRGDTDTGGGIAAGRWIQIHPTGRLQLQRDRAIVQGPRAVLGGC
jgi:type IV fimbrial biogenesis protein FimT